MKPCNTIQIDQAGLLVALRPYLIEVLDEAEKALINALSVEIMFDGVGRRQWRTEAAKAFKMIEQRITDDYLERKIGLNDLNLTEDEQVRIAVALFGNQAGGRLHSKPGQMVYGKEINGKHMSTAKTEYNLPDGFNQIANGGKMMENAIKLTTKYFRDALEQVGRNIPDSVFYDNVTVSGE